MDLCVELYQQGETVHRQTATLHNVLQCLGEGVLVADAQGRLVLVNSAAERMVGHGIAPAPPEHWPEAFGLYVPDGTRLFPADQLPLVRAPRGEECDDVEVLVKNAKRPEGTVLSVTGRPLRDENGRPCGGVIVVRDVTERRLAEQEVRRLNSELQSRIRDQQAANSELKAFCYSVSHDLRAPLRTIDGFSQAILQDYADTLDEQASDYLRRVRAATQRMGRLIDDLLELARVTRWEMRLEPVDLTALAWRSAEELRQREPSRSVDFVIQDGLQAHGDPRLLGILLDNLLENAWKYTSKHAHARIECGKLGTDSNPSHQADGRHTYFVRDDGAGFDMAYASKLFGAFQRLHSPSEFPGSGVGLAIIQRIVHRHGGRAWAEAAPERGAVFYFTL